MRRILSVTVTTEPEFDADQRDLMLGLQEFNADMGSHGQFISEATSEDADPNGKGKTRFVTTGPFTDYAEKSRLDAIDAYRHASGDDVNLNGLFWRVEKKTYK